jgi:ubiquinone/menaquinone biosynthesis C-methylase UbiE
MPTKLEIAKYYEREYLNLEPLVHLEDSKFKASEILSILKKERLNKTFSVVELGCGAGGVSKELERTIQFPIVGCDISSSILRIAKKVNKSLLLIKADCENIPIRSNSLDLVLLVDVIEHLNNPSKAIAESARISKKWVIIRTPFEDCLYHSLKKSKNDWASEWKSHCGHLWQFNLALIKKLLEQKGLIIVKIHISKYYLSGMNKNVVSNVIATVLTRLIPSQIYRRLLPSEHLILSWKKN